MQEYGVRGLWRGTGPTVVRLAFGAGINFVALENLKHFMLDVLPQGTGQLGFLQAAAVGGAWKAVAGDAAVRMPAAGHWQLLPVFLERTHCPCAPTSPGAAPVG
jgi:hypothetical protein